MLQLLKKLAIPRAVGTKGNNEIIQFLREFFEKSGYTVKSMPFTCKVWEESASAIEWENRKLKIRVSPYSKSFCGEGMIRIVETMDELSELECKDTILLLTGELSKEPLQPKDYPFYYPDEHKNLIDLLEQKKPLAIIAATDKHPMCGLDPYPLFEDGNFLIPSAYISENDYAKIRDEINGKRVRVCISSECAETESEQIYASKTVPNAKGKIVICAHMDSKNHTQGALDNASGIATMLKLAETLHVTDYDIDMVPFNCEEYYGANGELLYIDEITKNQDDIKLLINIDSVGHVGADVASSFYNVSEELTNRITQIINRREHTQLGMEWYAGDHAVFAFQGVACIAITSSDIAEGGLDCTHTMEDEIQTVDVKRLEDAASFVEELVSQI